jgi:hypothetical protein
MYKRLNEAAQAKTEHEISESEREKKSKRTLSFIFRMLRFFRVRKKNFIAPFLLLF